MTTGTGGEAGWDPYVMLNGELCRSSQAGISILDHGLLYGYGLFETLRIYGGAPFAVGRHLERLRVSAAVLQMDLPWPDEYLREAIDRVIQANDLEEAAIRLTVTRGSPGAPDGQGACFAAPRHWSPPPDEAYQVGWTAVVSALRRSSVNPLDRVKSLNFTLSWLARQEARQAGADEALLLNDRGCVASAAMANLFAVVGGELRTPPVEDGCLPGITRALVLRLAQEMGVRCSHSSLTIQDLQEADELFVTNSLIELMPVTRFPARAVGDGRPGRVTRELLQAYRGLVRSETSAC